MSTRLPWKPTPSKLLKLAALPTIVALTAAGCGTSSTPKAGSVSASANTGAIQVVAAENFWGSIAEQLGGNRVQVTSIITDPNADPHSYEPTPADARTIASAKMVIDNGIGYDPWTAKLLAADTGSRTVLNVGDVLGLKEGDNPHRWYNPADVDSVVTTITADYSKLDPADSAYFQRQRATFEGSTLNEYHNLISEIRTRYAGTPVGASESIFSMMAPALGVNLVTPYSFLRAISEGTDVSAADKITIDNQIKTHQIKVYVYNSQNTTPDIQAQLDECRAAGIPTTTITETLVPASSTFEAWQTRELQGILNVLHTATGR
ncbi:MAG TPA: zinc ABC transporter substrate-binding protein [Acidimicrobiales bacterium]|nr:zinc ABC transporter substrate-binding protein [Acidimicrobiales bacterium]